MTLNSPLTLTLSPVIGGEGIHFVTRSKKSNEPPMDSSQYPFFSIPA